MELLPVSLSLSLELYHDRCSLYPIQIASPSARQSNPCPNRFDCHTLYTLPPTRLGPLQTLQVVPSRPNQSHFPPLFWTLPLSMDRPKSKAMPSPAIVIAFLFMYSNYTSTTLHDEMTTILELIITTSLTSLLRPSRLPPAYLTTPPSTCRSRYPSKNHWVRLSKNADVVATLLPCYPLVVAIPSSSLSPRRRYPLAVAIPLPSLSPPSSVQSGFSLFQAMQLTLSL
ncbi:hypothetical protein PGTUg99_000616 [Puccinia graminis f. sp. tritici]|uniref:Uncharacterized protein n=1 Tax=Puccinia graminis f. sp. tritici TaxID=56615 RepID=A0A5B0RNS5_PUCGR|nr:hypothetical protein PGTUg99_000616 [Puccinia graminis f. sp. tritici]